MADMPQAQSANVTLYSSKISNASARLRIALNLKGLSYKLNTISLSQGDQFNPNFKALNPSGTVPLLIHHNEGQSSKVTIGQSLAALEYLEEAFSETRRLMPKDPALRARIRTLVGVLAIDTHPLLTHRVSRAIAEIFPSSGADPQAGNQVWDKYWLSEGFTKFEKLLENDPDRNSSKFCVGDEVTLADVVLMPEVWFARRIGVDMSDFHCISRICDELCSIEDIRKEEQTLE